mgnify:FL=1
MGTQSQYATAIAGGYCPACYLRPPMLGRHRCVKCIESQSKANRKYRKKGKAKYNAYMRAYMRARRLAQVQSTPDQAVSPPIEPTTYTDAPSRAWLEARLAALTGHANRA